jgi:hypothetical protein
LQDYDVALKLLLRTPGLLALRELTGVAIDTWQDAELPKIQNLRADLLGKAADGQLFHLELQSSNDGAMPLRMAAYPANMRARSSARFRHLSPQWIGCEVRKGSFAAGVIATGFPERSLNPDQ